MPISKVNSRRRLNDEESKSSIIMNDGNGAVGKRGVIVRIIRMIRTMP